MAFRSYSSLLTHPNVPYLWVLSTNSSKYQIQPKKHHINYHSRTFNSRTCHFSFYSLFRSIFCSWILFTQELSVIKYMAYKNPIFEISRVDNCVKKMTKSSHQQSQALIQILGNIVANITKFFTCYYQDRCMVNRWKKKKDLWSSNPKPQYLTIILILAIMWCEENYYPLTNYSTPPYLRIRAEIADICALHKVII